MVRGTLYRDEPWVDVPLRTADRDGKPFWWAAFQPDRPIAHHIPDREDIQRLRASSGSPLQPSLYVQPSEPHAGGSDAAEEREDYDAGDEGAAEALAELPAATLACLSRVFATALCEQRGAGGRQADAPQSEPTSPAPRRPPSAAEARKRLQRRLSQSRLRARVRCRATSQSLGVTSRLFAAATSVECALRAVEERLDARRELPRHAPARAVAALLLSDAEAAALVPGAALRRLVAELREGPPLLPLAELEELGRRAAAVAGSPGSRSPLARARCWLRRCAQRGAGAALGLLRHGAAAPAEQPGDAAVTREHWVEVLGRLRWPGHLSDALRAFEEGDFRGNGRPAAAELLFEEVHACRRWFEERVGSRERVHALLEHYLVHRTARQKEEGKASAQQWRSFVAHCGCPGREAAQAAFERLDPRGDGEVRTALLVGLEAWAAGLAVPERHGSRPPRSGRAHM